MFGTASAELSRARKPSFSDVRPWSARGRDKVVQAVARVSIRPDTLSSVAGPFITEVDAPGGRVPVRAWDAIPSVCLFPSAGEYPYYDDFAHGEMIKDETRMARYTAAVRRYAPGRTVLDIGTGQDALWALEAARAGASHVWAVEVIARSAELARGAVARAGFAGRVTVLEGMSTDIDLPSPVDFCVSEIIGTIGGSEGAGAVLRDARQRLVRPGGILAPHRCVTTAAAIDLDRAGPLGFPDFALTYVREIFAAVGRPFDLRVCLVGLQDAYVSDVAEVEPLDFNGSLQPEGTDHVSVTFTRAGRFHGLALGMRLWVADHDEPIDSLIQQSNWLPVYAPLSDVGLPVRPGDRFTFDFVTTLSDDGVHPDYELHGELHGDGKPSVALGWCSTHHHDGFRGSPFYQSLFPSVAGSDQADDR
jgi:protein arginine N-methyltransferase 1